MEQRSNQWFEARKGLFTGSEMHKLLKGGRRDMTEAELEEYKRENPKGKRTTIDSMFGDTALGYIFEKATEVVFGVDQNAQDFETFDMRRGKELEPIAFKHFRDIKALDFIEVKECSFMRINENSGASPDGLVGDYAILEIKCPRPNKFFKLIKDGYDAIDEEYKVQVQVEMMAAKVSKAYFFNYIIYNGEEMWHEIEIEKDEAMCQDILERIEQASIIRDAYVAELRLKRQF